MFCSNCSAVFFIHFASIACLYRFRCQKVFCGFTLIVWYVKLFLCLCHSLCLFIFPFSLSLLHSIDAAICLVVPFCPWCLVRLVSNFVSHRDWNKLRALWGIFTAYLYNEKKHFFPSFTISKLCAAALVACTLSLSLSYQFIPRVQSIKSL